MSAFILSFDLETLSTRSNAAIVQIGAAAYSMGRKRLFTFETTLGFNVEDTEQVEAHVDRDTENWWSQAKQADAYNAIMDSLKTNGPVTRREAITQLRDWIIMSAEDAGPFNDLQVYGNGATFDVSILEHHFNAIGWKAPWPFWNVRDLRTLKEMGQLAGCTDVVTRQGTHHTALADAIHQLEMIHMYRDYLANVPRHGTQVNE